MRDGGQGIVKPGCHDRLGRGSKPCRDGLLPAGGHLDEVSHPSQDPALPQQVGGAVTLLRRQAQGLRTCGESGFLPRGACLLLHQPSDFGLTLCDSLAGPLPGSVQARLVGAQPGEGVLGLPVPVRGLPRPREGLLPAAG